MKRLRKTDDYRKIEGKTLEKDLLLRINIIGKKLLLIDNFEKDRTTQVRERILSKLNELNSDTLDKNRFEQEIIYYIEKLDITEEKIRLEQHLDYFINTMNTPKSEGKKLGFIAQEIGREINTLGSKAQEANMQKLVVEMKDELEKDKRTGIKCFIMRNKSSLFILLFTAFTLLSFNSYSQTGKDKKRLIRRRDSKSN